LFPQSVSLQVVWVLIGIGEGRKKEKSAEPAAAPDPTT
jgi:hypothetical protein